MAADHEQVEVFISYSHKDERARQALETHLSMLRRQGLISVWHDRRIGAGTEWKGQIDTHLDSAQLILLLINADFLASDYCYDIELKRAMGRHEAGAARVVPVIVRRVDWHHAPFWQAQALPQDGKAISTWRDRDTAYNNVIDGLRRVIRELDLRRVAAYSVAGKRTKRIRSRTISSIRVSSIGDSVATVELVTRIKAKVWLLLARDRNRPMINLPKRT